MYDLATIKILNKEAEERALAKWIKPHLILHESEIDQYPPFPFPNIGSMKVELSRVDTLFCDTSGFGSESEPALTIRQLKEKLKDLLREHGPLRVAIVSTGTFQAYLDVWRAEVDS